ncbi:hypothetical protein JW905_09335 [bacterium]|nr:hypothetical protein [candidate division CSSED10-310 bacterium]
MMRARRHYIWALMAGLISAALFTLPPLAGYRSAARDNKVFLGFIRSDDYHRYGSFMEQARREHRFLFLDHSALGPQDPRILAIVFWGLGRAAALLGQSSATMWLLFRFTASPLLFLSLVYFMQRAFPDDPIMATRVLWLATVSTGLDYLLAPLLVIPRLKNFWMDGFSTFHLHHNPLKVLAMALLLLFLAQVLDTHRRGVTIARTITSCFLFAALWAVHPNTAIVAYCSFGLLPLALLVTPAAQRHSRSDYLRFFLPHAVPALVIGSFILWMRRDPVVAHIISCYQVSAREPFINYPIRYGLLILPAAAALVHWARRRSTAGLLVAGWLLVGVITSNLRILTGLLFQHTIHLPLVIAAAAGIPLVLPRRRIRTAVLVICGLYFAAIQSFSLVQICRQTVGDVWPTSLYASRDEMAALEYLGRCAPGNVLVNRNLGNKVGFVSLQNSFLGHWGTTPERGRKEREFARFIDPLTTLQWKERLLDRYGIRYILYSRTEMLVAEPDPRLPTKRIFSSGQTEIFEVDRQASNSAGAAE